jgi:hypothetical protein
MTRRRVRTTGRSPAWERRTDASHSTVACRNLTTKGTWRTPGLPHGLMVARLPYGDEPSRGPASWDYAQTVAERERLPHFLRGGHNGARLTTLIYGTTAAFEFAQTSKCTLF